MFTKFTELNIKPEISHCIDELGFTAPTPVQAEVIPYILDGKDCLAQAPTGTGKTLAFGIPALNMVDVNDSSIQTLILCPTRELAIQIDNEIKSAAKYLEGVRILSIYGGQPIQRQLSMLKKRPQIIVGTPGRVLDHIRRRTLKLGNLKMLVLDEADEMLDMGFREDIDTVLTSISNSTHQTVLFSATMSKEIQAISTNYQKDPFIIKLTCGTEVIPQIEQRYVRVKESRKFDAFLNIWRTNDYKVALVFCNTKRKVDELNAQCQEQNILAEALHGDLRQRARDIVMQKYRNHELNILIATDVAARGIDVKNIEAVINYDIPRDDEYYIHRIGRTARANTKGVAINLVTDKEMRQIKVYERITKQDITEMKIDGISLESPIKDSDGGNSRNNPDNVRIFMTVGEKDNIKPKDLEAFIIENTKVTSDDIVEIKTLELFSFVEVTKTCQGEMLSLKDKTFAGRRLAVEVSADKPRPSSHGASRSGDRFGRGERNDRRPSNDFHGDRPANGNRGGFKFKEGYTREDKPRESSEYRDGASSRPRYNDEKPAFNAEKPRYSREEKPRYSSDSKPSYNRDGASDKPSYNRDSKPRYNDDKPRYNSDFKPGYNRDGAVDRPRFTAASKPSYNRDGAVDRPRFTSASKPSYNRDGASDRPKYNSDSKPSYNRDGASDRPKYNSDTKPSYNRDGASDRPRYNSDSKPSYNRDGASDRPRYNSDSKPSYNRDGASDRPRYNSDSKPSYNRDGASDRPKYNSDSKPSYNRDGASDRPRYNSDSKPRYNDDKPRFSSDKPRYNSDSKPRSSSEDDYRNGSSTRPAYKHDSKPSSKSRFGAGGSKPYSKPQGRSTSRPKTNNK